MLKRYNLDLAFEEPIPQNVAGLLNAMEVAIRNVKKFAVKINKGQMNEEATVKATWHRCYHDEVPVKSCELEQEL